MLLKSVTEKSRKIKTFLEMNKDDTPYQSLQDTAKQY